MHHGQRFSDENAFQLDAAAAVVYTSFSYLSNVSLCLPPLGLLFYAYISPPVLPYIPRVLNASFMIIRQTFQSF